MMYTDDPIADAEAYLDEQAKYEERFPVCTICGEHILDDNLYDIEGEIYCEECLKECFLKDTEDYIEEDKRGL